MPRVEVRFFRDDHGRVPVFDWMAELRRTDARGFFACWERIRLLSEFGFELRRPHADILCDGIHELRIRSRRAQFRILYFFHGRTAVVLTHALQKEGRIPEIDIARALARKRRFDANPVGRAEERGQEDA